MMTKDQEVSVKERIIDLETKRRLEVSEINKKYNDLMQKAYSLCDHSFTEWKVNYHGALPDTNINGDWFERRKCKKCGFKESRIKKTIKQAMKDE